MYHEDIFHPFLPMFSTFDVKMVNVVENAECFCDTNSKIQPDESGLTQKVWNLFLQIFLKSFLIPPLRVNRFSNVQPHHESKMSFTFPCFFLGINQLSLKSKWSNCNWTSISQSPNNEDVSPEKWQQQDGANSGLSNMSVTVLNNILFKLAHTLHRTGFLFLKSF